MPKIKDIQERKKVNQLLRAMLKEMKGNTRKNKISATSAQELNKLDYFIEDSKQDFKRKPKVISVSLEPSKDVFLSTETSSPATAGTEGVAELAPSVMIKRPIHA